MAFNCSICNIPIVPMQATKTMRNNGRPLCTKCEEKINTDNADNLLPKPGIFEKEGYEIKDMIARRMINNIDVGLNIAKLQAGNPDIEVVDVGGYPWERKDNLKLSALIDYELAKFKKLLNVETKQPSIPTTPETKKPIKEETQKMPEETKKTYACVVCKTEVPLNRVMDCNTYKIPITCGDECEAKLPKEKEQPTLSSKVPAKKTEFVAGHSIAAAKQYGIPAELANMFFMTLNDGLYIKNPGLLYIASKKGYGRIEIKETFNEANQEWEAECKIFPKITKEMIEGISHLDKDMQRIAWEYMTAPTNGTGRASKISVKMATMHPFLKEMAQTRAQNRALRAFTGYGGTSMEELPEGQLERD